MRILGIDPGFGRMGVAVMEKDGKENLLYSVCFSTPKRNNFSERIGYLEKELEKVITEWRPEEVAIERLFFTTNQKTAMQVAEVRGMVLALLTRNDLPCHEYTPGQVKVAVTGDGRATKKAIANMVRIFLPNIKPIKFDDEYDAIAIGITCLSNRRQGNT